MGFESLQRTWKLSWDHAKHSMACAGFITLKSNRTCDSQSGMNHGPINLLIRRRNGFGNCSILNAKMFGSRHTYHARGLDFIGGLTSYHLLRGHRCRSLDLYIRLHMGLKIRRHENWRLSLRNHVSILATKNIREEIRLISNRQTAWRTTNGGSPRAGLRGRSSNP